MKSIFLMTWRYICFNKLKTSILISCLTITILLPMAVNLLINYYDDQLSARAELTPLIVGTKGNRYDLVLKSLYFSDATPDLIKWQQVQEITDSDLARAIPLNIKFTAQDRAVVGTSLEYFEFRQLTLQRGSLPQIVGDAVLGAKAARSLGLTVGDSILSDQKNLYDISSAYPLKMNIVGVFAESRTPDDYAVFVDVKTTWIIEGLAHGHKDITKADDKSVILKRQDKNVIANAALTEYRKITKDNINSFHFHGDINNFPLTSVIVLPHSVKSATLLKSRYNTSETRQIVVPTEVIQELMGIVFKVKRFFDANFVLITLTTSLFMVLIVILSLQIRDQEMKTMFKIGCSRKTVCLLQVTEITFLLALSLVAAGVLTAVLMLSAPHIMKIV